MSDPGGKIPEAPGATAEPVDAAAPTAVLVPPPQPDAIDPPTEAPESTGLGVRRAWMLGLAAAAALLATQAYGDQRAWRGIALTVGAIVLFALSVDKSAPRERHHSWIGIGDWPAEARHGVAASALATIVLFFIVDVFDVSATAWILQAAAVALIVAGARFADRTSRSRLPVPRSPLDLSTMTTQVVLGLLIVLGTWVRFRHLGSVPRGVWFDEADAGNLARRISEEGFRPVFGNDVPAYHPYLIAFVSSIFGEGVTSLRAVTALAGVATIPAGYLVGRELWGNTAGLVMAALIAFSRWSITLSRVAMNNVMLPLLALLTLGFLLRGRRRQSHVDFALAGLSAGAGMLFYSSISTSLVAIGIFALWVAWHDRQPLRSLGPQLLVFVIAGLAATAPLLRFIFEDSERYLARNRQTALWSDAGLADNDSVLDALWSNIKRFGGMTHYAGDRNGRHNIPAEPMLPTAVAGLSILGLGATILRVDRWFAVLALVWLPLGFLPGLLSLPWEAPNTLRALGVQCVAFLAVTAAVVAIGRTLVRSDEARTVVLAGIVVVIGLTGLFEVRSYFDANRNRDDVWGVHSTAETVAAQLTAEAPESTTVLLTSFLRGSPTQVYLTRDTPPDAIFDTEAQLPLHVPRGNDALILTRRDAFDIEFQAAQLYPTATIDDRFEGRDSGLVAIRIPAAEIEASLGWTVAPDGDAFRHSAALIVDRTGFYSFRIGPDDPTSPFVINGLEVLPCDADPAIPLSKGVHLVEFTSPVEFADPDLRWLEPGAVEFVAVPADRLVQERFLPGGLLTRHHPDLEPATPPSLYEIDGALNLRMHEPVLAAPYRTRWSGAIRNVEPGSYELFLRSDGEVDVAIDGAPVIRKDQGFAEVTAVVELAGGELVPIEVDYRFRSGFSEVTLLWRPAGATDTPPMVIPQRSLVPWTTAERIGTCT